MLLFLKENPDSRLREAATAIGITERAAQRIVVDLEQAGYLTHERVGRRNHYTLTERMGMRHPLVRHHAVGELLEAMTLLETGPRPSGRAGDEGG